jgi:hypothetical protein
MPMDASDLTLFLVLAAGLGSPTAPIGSPEPASPATWNDRWRADAAWVFARTAPRAEGWGFPQCRDGVPSNPADPWQESGHD